MVEQISSWVAATLERVGPVVAEHADEGERARRLPTPVVEALRDAGLFRMMSPKSLGGMEPEPQAFFDVVEEVSRIDGSAGWCLFIAGGGVTLGKFLPDHVAEEVFGNPDTIISGSIFPPGRAVAVDGGFRFSGRWSYASGCQHSTWSIGAAVTFEADKPRLTPAGTPEMRGGLVPTSEIQIVDCWEVSGLCATGSNDWTLDNHFIPADYSFQIRPAAGGRHYQGALYRMPFLTTFGFPQASVAVGIARGAIDRCTEAAASKVPRGPELTLQQRPVFQYQLADAIATVSSGRAWLREEIDAAWRSAQRDEAIPIPQRARMWLSASHAVRSAAHATDIVYTATGGAANFRSNPLQRALRDVRAVTQHVAVSPQSMENNGRILAGLDPVNPLIFCSSARPG